MIGGDNGENGDNGDNGETSMLKVPTDQRTLPKGMRRLTAVGAL